MSIISMNVVVLDCPDPQRLADFYAGVLGWKTDTAASDDNWVEIEGAGGRLAFQKSPGHVPPEWPGVEHGQQLHLDFDVPKAQMGEAEKQVLALGAQLVQPDAEGRRFRVYLDPAGHPFCLCAC